jgi:hypothetical protein
MSNEIIRTEIEVPIDHPLEEVFDIEPGTTLLPTTVRETQQVTMPSYDEKDKEVENQFNEVYDSAMGAFESLYQETEVIEGKYKARSGEVAVQFLNAALAAAQSKSQLKQHKDKISTVVNKGPSTVNNNLIVGDRNDILRQLRGLDVENIPVTKIE